MWCNHELYNEVCGEVMCHTFKCVLLIYAIQKTLLCKYIHNSAMFCTVICIIVKLVSMYMHHIALCCVVICHTVKPVKS